MKKYTIRLLILLSVSVISLILLTSWFSENNRYKKEVKDFTQYYKDVARKECFYKQFFKKSFENCYSGVKQMQDKNMTLPLKNNTCPPNNALITLNNTGLKACTSF